jgi:hypothetical protein
MEISVLTFVLVILVLVVDVWLIANLWKSQKKQQVKLGWAALIVLLPVIGWIIWARFGPRGMTSPPSSSEHAKG